MKKNYIYQLLTCFFLIPVAISAQQVSQNIIKAFPPAVVVKVSNVISSTKSNEQTQLALARFFSKEDSILSKAISNGAAVNEINSIKSSLQTEFKTILNGAELDAYYMAIREADARLFLKNKMAVLDSVKTLTASQKNKIESSFLANVNNNRNGLLPVIFKKVFKENINDTTYYGAVYNNKIAKIESGGKTPKSWYSNVLQHKDALKLTAQQVNQLISKNIELNKARDIKDPKSSEILSEKYVNQEIAKILSNAQLNTLELLRHEKPATEWANENWKEIKDRGLAKGLDSISVLKELVSYRLTTTARKAVNNKYGKEPLPHSNLTKPAILRKLDAARKAVANNNQGAYKW